MKNSTCIKFIIVALTLIYSTTTLYGQTQLEINTKAKLMYLQSDSVLNHSYQTILSKYRIDTTFTNNLKQAQRLWTKWRDAEMMAMYPERTPYYYGSIQPLCWYSHLQKLTEQRIKQLSIWLINEDDGCGPMLLTD